MARLVEAMEALGIEGEVEFPGRWVRPRGERCTVYIEETRLGEYLTWCNGRCDQVVRRYLDATETILAGLWRAVHLGNGRRAGSGNR